jgi:excisionase family DNA binding protein
VSRTVTPLALDRAGVAEATTLSEREIARLVRSGEIPHVRQGRRVLFPTKEIERWLSSRVAKKPRRAASPDE